MRQKQCHRKNASKFECLWYFAFIEISDKWQYNELKISNILDQYIFGHAAFVVLPDVLYGMGFQQWNHFLVFKKLFQ